MALAMKENHINNFELLFAANNIEASKTTLPKTEFLVSFRIASKYIQLCIDRAR